MKGFKLDRRNMLKYLGGTLALPMLESLGAENKNKAPKRIIFVSFTYGMMSDYFPTTSGIDYKLTEGMKPLARHKKDFTMMGNLTNKNVFHPHRSCTTFLTGADTRSTPGVEFSNDISCDQIMAKQIGQKTRFSTLPLNARSHEGGWGPGLSMSWGDAGRPIQGINGPTRLYHKMFGGGDVTLEQRKNLLAEKRSLLDTVLSDAKSLNRKITKSDKERVESYFESIRDIERTISKEKQWINKPLPKATLPEPSFQLKGVDEITTMFDLMAAACQSDLTRIMTYRIHCGELLKSVGAKVTGVHPVSHYRGNKSATESARLRDLKLTEMLAVLYDKFKAAKDVDGKSLFDNSIIVFGNEIRHGHTTSDIPLIIGGYGGGGMKHKGHILYESKKTRLCNLWVSFMNHMGVNVKKFSDSDGRIDDLFV